MRGYLAYFKYVAVHKWFVLLECFKRGLFWRGLVHDWDKFLPFSFFAYANLFYNKDGSKKQKRDATGYYKPTDTGNQAFEEAWFVHTRLHQHHWQYWVLATERGQEKIIPMSRAAVMEMYCDWVGAGKAQGTPDTKAWWEANKEKMRFHPDTYKQIEALVYT